MSLQQNYLTPTYRYAIGNRLRREFIKKWLPTVEGVGFNFGSSDSDWAEFLPSQAKMWRMDIDPSVSKNIDLLTDIQCAGLQTESLDWILCSEVIEHVPDFKAALKEIYRCLKSNGKCILTVPFSIPLHGEPHDYWRFTPHAIRTLAHELGFKLIYLEPIGHFGAFIWQSCAVEYHRRFAWVPSDLPFVKKMLLTFIQSTVPFFCSLCYWMAFLKKPNQNQSGNTLCWGACMEKSFL